MKFGRVPVAQAEGATLAHGAGALKKGRTLTAADIAALTAAKVETITIARLDADDVGEDAAAQRIGEAARGSGTTLSAAHTGRTNLYSAHHGVARVDAARVNALNAIHESITIATLNPFEVVEQRQMLATIKIIPYAAPAWAVSKAEEIAHTALVSVAPFVPKKIALISTTLPGMKASLLDKNKAVLAARAETLGS